MIFRRNLFAKPRGNTYVKARVKIEGKPVDLCVGPRGIIVFPRWIYRIVFAHFMCASSILFLLLSLSLSFALPPSHPLFLPSPIFTLVRNALGSCIYEQIRIYRYIETCPLCVCLLISGLYLALLALVVLLKATVEHSPFLSLPA